MNVKQLRQILENAKKNGIPDNTKVVVSSGDHRYREVFDARFVEAEVGEGNILFEVENHYSNNIKVFLII